MSGTHIFIADRPINYGRWIQIGYVLTDLFLVIGNSCVVFFLRYIADWGYWPVAALSQRGGDYSFLNHYWGLVVIWAALIVVMCQEQDLYRTSRTQSALEEALAVTRAISFATLLLIIVIYLADVQGTSHLAIGACAVLNLVTLEAWRYCKRRIVI